MLLYIYIIIIYIYDYCIYIYCQFAAEFLIKGGGPTWQPQGTHRRGKKSGPLIKHCYGSPMLSTNTWICLRGSKRSHIFPIISPISGGFPVGKNTPRNIWEVHHETQRCRGPSCGLEPSYDCLDTVQH